jgi:hypothetical protein
LLHTIRERAAHLGISSRYAVFARLPSPRPRRQQWADLLRDLGGISVRAGGFSARIARYFRPRATRAGADQPSEERAESGGDAEKVELSVSHAEGLQRIEVRDRGQE